MALKWGNTNITAVKWGNTDVTAVYWGGTKVWPDRVYIFGEYAGQYNEARMNVRTASGASAAGGTGRYGGHHESQIGYFLENDYNYYESDQSINDVTYVKVTLSTAIPAGKTLHMIRNSSGLWVTAASYWAFYSPYGTGSNSSGRKYNMFSGDGYAATTEHAITLAYDIYVIEMSAMAHKGTHFMQCWLT